MVKNGGSGGFELGFRPVKKVFSAFLFLIGLSFAIIILSTIWYGFTRGQLPSIIVIALEKVHLDKPIVSLVGFIYNIATARYENVNTGFAGTTTTVQADIGINVKDFAPNKDTVALNEPILARATIEVVKTPQDKEIRLDFSNACYLQDYTDSNAPGQVIVSPINKIITNQENYVFPVRCEFPQGFTNVGNYSLTDITQKTTVTRTSDFKKIRFTPSFNYVQEIDWQPFTKYVYESTDTVMNPTWDLSDGPASLRVGSEESQPFYSNDQHELYVYLTSNWPGSIKAVNSLQLALPNDMELLTDDKFCDFVSSGNGYILKAPVLEKTKIDCGSKDVIEKIKMYIPIVQSSITFDQCIKDYKGEFKFTCPFVVRNAEKISSRTQINVKANYIYEMEETNSITLVNTGTNQGVPT